MTFPRTVVSLAVAALMGASPTALALAQDAPLPTAPATPAPAPQDVSGQYGEAVAAVVNDDIISTYDLRQRMLLLMLEARVRPTQSQLPAIQRAAEGGDPSRHRFTRPLLNRGQRLEDAEYYDFSFSGLKTALRNRVREVEREGTLDAEVPHLAAAFQDAVVDVLTTKTMRAVKEKECRKVVLGGGVANSRALRAEITRRLGGRGAVYAPSPRLSTDNAAMIARAAAFHYARGEVAGLDLNARADLPFPGLRKR